MITYVFPGQGSQYKGMGGALFDDFPELVTKADEILGYSIRQLCLEDPRRKLNQTQYTQPALFTVNALSYLKKIKDTGRKPDYVAGHSLGEYNALFASGAFDFETGLMLVKKRGELMSRVSNGGMAAILGLCEERIIQILKQNDVQDIEIANYNTPSQLVVSGLRETIEPTGILFEDENVLYIPLNVSGAFHSSYMEDAKKTFEEYLNLFDFTELTIPVISNVHARPYKQGDIKKNLADQITHGVKWTDSIQYLMGLGVEEFEEIGPGEVLTKLILTTKKETELNSMVV